MKIVLIIVGVLAGLFAIGQFLQLLGLIGVGFTTAGVAFTILGAVVSFVCLRKALGRGRGL